MDGQRFDELTRVLGVSLNRKRFLAFVAGIVAPIAAGGPDEVAAKKKGGKGKRRRHRRRDDGHVGGQGGASCGAACSTVEDCLNCPNSLCIFPLRELGGEGDFGVCASDCGLTCESDQDCEDLPGNCFCTGSNGDSTCFCDEPCGICGGLCLKDSDCDHTPGCVCDELAGFCRTVVCGGECGKDADCAPLPGCVCDLDNNTLRVGAEQLPGQCVTATCGGTCEDDGDCLELAPDCLCDIPFDEEIGECVTITCAGLCFKDAECPPLSGCVCSVNIIDADRAGAEGVPVVPGQCFTEACPGFCTINDDCTRRGAPDCVCFEGRPNAQVIPAGEFGFCETCRTTGESCRGSNECCGQLVCEGVSASGANGLAGTCRAKRPPPPRRCRKHGQSCNRDGECCAQGQCYQGTCGEKDTHCHNDRECARGYRCQGGRLSPGHRRCRKNGKRAQHLAHKRRWRK